MSTVDDIAAAVTTELNSAPAGTFNQTFTAQQLYVPLFDLKDLGTLHVSVVPKARVEEAENRSQTMNGFDIDIAVHQKIADWTAASISPLLTLCEQIGKYFRLRRLNEVSAMWWRTEHRTLYSVAELREKHLFVSVMTLTYKMVM
jgi:hypothetical protein